jgi:hypothetical protein
MDSVARFGVAPVVALARADPARACAELLGCVRPAPAVAVAPAAAVAVAPAVTVAVAAKPVVTTVATKPASVTVRSRSTAARLAAGTPSPEALLETLAGTYADDLESENAASEDTENDDEDDDENDDDDDDDDDDDVDDDDAPKARNTHMLAVRREPDTDDPLVRKYARDDASFLGIGTGGEALKQRRKKGRGT